MHGLGLRHTFEGTYNYKDYKTDNYMDYKNNKRHTYKWQWEKLHEYEKLK
ncbi:metallopeptidase [Tenacibaculum maritimum]